MKNRKIPFRKWKKVQERSIFTVSEWKELLGEKIITPRKLFTSMKRMSRIPMCSMRIHVDETRDKP